MPRLGFSGGTRLELKGFATVELEQLDHKGTNKSYGQEQAFHFVFAAQRRGGGLPKPVRRTRRFYLGPTWLEHANEYKLYSPRSELLDLRCGFLTRRVPSSDGAAPFKPAKTFQFSDFFNLMDLLRFCFTSLNFNFHELAVITSLNSVCKRSVFQVHSMSHNFAAQDCRRFFKIVHSRDQHFSSAAQDRRTRLPHNIVANVSRSCIKDIRCFKCMTHKDCRSRHLGSQIFLFKELNFSNMLYR